jgi:hypothetical protein
MREFKKEVLSEVGQPRVDVWVGYEMQWPVYEYEPVLKPSGLVEYYYDRYVHRPRHGLVAEELLRPAERVLWPHLGVFAPKGWATGKGRREPVRIYKPLEMSDEIFLAIQHVRDLGSMLRFINQYGVLGVGITDHRDFPFDGVRQTGYRLAALQSQIADLQLLNKRRMGGTAEIREQYADTLNGLLPYVQLMVRPSTGGLQPLYRVESLFDVIALHIWEVATGGGRLRRCHDPKCGARFIPHRANQTYCRHACANRAAVRQWKRRQKHVRKGEHA